MIASLSLATASSLRRSLVLKRNWYQYDYKMLARITRSKTKQDTKRVQIFKPGSYVWAKMDGQFWAAIIVSHSDVGFHPPTSGKSWIFWFGDYRVSEVRHSLMTDFCEEYRTHFTRSRRKWMAKERLAGVFEAIWQIGLPDTETLSKKELIRWARVDLADAYLKKYVITDFVKEKLSAIRNMNVRPDPDARKVIANQETRKIIENYKAGKISTLSFCLGCYSDRISEEHPVFLGYFCVDCKERFKKNFYKTHETSKAPCIICAFKDVMIGCKNDECKLAYCIQCIQDLASRDTYEKLCSKKVWYCFICYENKEYRGVLSVKYNWKDNMKTLLSKERKSLSPSAGDVKEDATALNTDNKITSVLTATFQLQDKSGMYYSSGTSDFIEVTENNYPAIITVFSSKQLTQTEKKNMIPVNLLVCSRRSTNETGTQCPTLVLYEFHRVVKSLGVHNVPFYWVFEWNADISLQKQVMVTRLLQHDPVLIKNGDLKSLSLVWSNIPHDATNAELCQRNILFTDRFCYQH